MKHRIIVAIVDNSGMATLAELVRRMRISARVLKPHLDALIAVGAISVYTDEDYARDSGEPIRYPVRPEHDGLYGFTTGARETAARW